MNISIRYIKEPKVPCDVLILPVFKGESRAYSWLDPKTALSVRKAFLYEFQGEINQVFTLQPCEHMKARMILLTGLGEKESVSPEQLRQAGGTSASYILGTGMKSAALSSHSISTAGLSPVDFIEGFLLKSYRFSRYITDVKQKEKGITRFILLGKKSRELTQKLRWTKNIASAVTFARDLVNTPSNRMTPFALAQKAKLLQGKNLTVTVLDRKEAKRLGMEAYLSVAQGSSELPKFILLDYKGKEEKPVVLIGKSVTFDSGGISLKPPNGMERMKSDMAGGAAVLGVMQAVSRARMRVHVIGILPATENLPGGSAAKPGDVVTALTGKTIEIISTDAEGRMTLADAIGYAQRFKPRAIIDIATLTGACAIAFGAEISAMMGNERELLELMKKAADDTNEHIWEMPLADAYRDYLKSDVADLKNTGGRSGSLMTSAYFLSQFAGSTPWVHLDIAGTAWAVKEKPYTPIGASGFGVRLLAAFIKDIK